MPMKKDSMPFVSVIMGVYSRGEDTTGLARSIHSIMMQREVDLELIVCAGGSSETIQSFLHAQAALDPRIRLVGTENEPTDLGHKLNVCLKYAHGEYIARMDDDDYSHPNRMKLQLRYLEAHPEIDFVGCNVNLMKDKELQGTRMFPEFPVIKDFYFVQPFIHPTLMFRKRALVSVGGYSEEKRCILCEDYDLLLRLYAVGSIGANLQEIVFDYTLPHTVKGNRKMRHRWNEVLTRYARFKDLGVLKQAFPYVIKPILVGLLPNCVLGILKRHR